VNPISFLRLCLWLLILPISALAADSPCDCTIYPFVPNPPCSDVCTSKHLAIASLADLVKIFGLPYSIAEKIANIPPGTRPRSLDAYKELIPGTAYQVFRERIQSLTAQDFQAVRHDALTNGITIENLNW
jgi:hypothetical protein